MDSVLTDGRGATEDNGGFTFAYAVAVLIPRCGKGETRLVVESGGYGHGANPEGSSLLIGYLLGVLATREAGILTYCWKVDESI